MKEDWLRKVRDKMTDYEIDEPLDLWNSIESKRGEISSASRSVKNPAIKLWVKRSIAAAMIAVVISLSFYILDINKINKGTNQKQLISSVSDESIINVKKERGNIHEKTMIASGSENLIAQNKTLSNNTAASLCAPTTESFNRSAETDFGFATDSLNNIQTDNRSEPEAEPENIHDNQKEQKENKPHDREWTSSLNDNKLIASIYPDNSHAGNFSVSIYSSGGAGSSLNYNSKGDPFVSSLGPESSEWEDNPKLGILLFNQGKDIRTDFRHRLPIRGGVSFMYNLSERFGLESGLGYTILISDIKEGSENHYYSGEQKLHYIGIPVNLKYRAFSWKRLDLYASAGVLAEKCVSANVSKEFVLKDEKRGSETEKLSEKPLQFSANAALGVQCKLINLMSVFVEPGISYYFKDGTSIQTIYKEKPLNFNLNMGLRFTFGK